ncbi:MAG: hypothetical protein Q9186_005923 [Xanthomendoza sp. 1 TL-2023]
MSITILPSTNPRNPWHIPTPSDETQLLPPKPTSSDPSKPITWTEAICSGTKRPWPGLQDSSAASSSPEKLVTESEKEDEGHEPQPRAIGRRNPQDALGKGKDDV